jgi:ribulose-phosphate 3-epimerase
VTGKPIVVCENIDAPLLGCAILASVAVGIFPDVDKAVQCMVRTERRIEPNQESHFIYSKLYNGVYNKLSSALKPFSHALFDIRGGQTENKLDYSISPSLLACDWSDMKTEITRCLAAKVPRLHVDVFDGVFLDSPYALTFGPKMVQAIRSVSEKAMIDIHLCVDRPERFIEALAKAGADRLIFQWEAMGGEEQSKLEQALVFSQEIKKNGMMCGISLNPETNTDEIIPLLESGAVDVIDILAVEPGRCSIECRSIECSMESD